MAEKYLKECVRFAKYIVDCFNTGIAGQYNPPAWDNGKIEIYLDWVKPDHLYFNMGKPPYYFNNASKHIKVHNDVLPGMEDVLINYINVKGGTPIKDRENCGAAITMPTKGNKTAYLTCEISRDELRPVIMKRGSFLYFCYLVEDIKRYVANRLFTGGKNLPTTWYLNSSKPLKGKIPSYHIGEALRKYHNKIDIDICRVRTASGYGMQYLTPKYISGGFLDTDNGDFGVRSTDERYSVFGVDDIAKAFLELGNIPLTSFKDTMNKLFASYRVDTGMLSILRVLGINSIHVSAEIDFAF